MYFFFSSRRRHTSWPRDWSSDVCSSDLKILGREKFFIDVFEESTWFKARAAQFKAVVSALPRLFLETVAVFEIGRASCRERACASVDTARVTIERKVF